MSSLMYPFDFREGQTSKYYLHDYSLGSQFCERAKTEVSGEVKGRIRTISRCSKENDLSHEPDLSKTTDLLIDGGEYQQVHMVLELTA